MEAKTRSRKTRQSSRPEDKNGAIDAQLKKHLIKVSLRKQWNEYCWPGKAQANLQNTWPHWPYRVPGYAFGVSFSFSGSSCHSAHLTWFPAFGVYLSWHCYLCYIFRVWPVHNQILAFTNPTEICAHSAKSSKQLLVRQKKKNFQHSDDFQSSHTVQPWRCHWMEPYEYRSKLHSHAYIYAVIEIKTAMIVSQHIKKKAGFINQFPEIHTVHPISYQFNSMLGMSSFHIFSVG